MVVRSSHEGFGHPSYNAAKLIGSPARPQRRQWRATAVAAPSLSSRFSPTHVVLVVLRRWPEEGDGVSCPVLMADRDRG
jgi:hypothetical protein